MGGMGATKARILRCPETVDRPARSLGAPGDNSDPGDSGAAVLKRAIGSERAAMAGLFNGSEAPEGRAVPD